MLADNEALKIFTDFSRFVKTNEPQDISTYSLPQLQRAIIQLERERTHPAFGAINLRISALIDEKRQTEKQRTGRKDMLIGFVLGVLGTIVASLILRWVFKLNG